MLVTTSSLSLGSFTASRGAASKSLLTTESQLNWKLCRSAVGRSADRKSSNAVQQGRRKCLINGKHRARRADRWKRPVR